MKSHRETRAWRMATLFLVGILLPWPIYTAQTPTPPGSLPPGADDAIGLFTPLADSLDSALATVDPTNGTLPTSSALRSRSVVAGLQQKLVAYQELLLSGQIKETPLDNVSFANLTVREGFLPNETYAAGLDLLSGLLGAVGEIVPEPTACIQAPAGAMPATDVVLDATCSTDVQDSSRNLTFRWDFTSDGAWDTAWASQATVTHQFSGLGTTTVTVQARDLDLLMDQASVSLILDNPPTPCFTVTPQAGTTETTFRVDASCSTDDVSEPENLQAAWDFDGDGAWDTAWTTAKNADHQYGETGDHTIRLGVRNPAELQSEATRVVTVSLPSAEPASDDSPSGPNSPYGRGVGIQLWGGRLPRLPPLLASLFNDILDLVYRKVEEHAPATGPLPVLFQRTPNGSYEPAAAGEAQYWPGARLRLNPNSPVVQALVGEAWLRTAFGTFGSAAPFNLTYHNGTRYGVVTDPAMLSGQADAFGPVVLGQSPLYTTGHLELVSLGDRSMVLSFPEYPGWVTETRARANGTENLVDRAPYRLDRLAIRLTAADASGQTVTLDRSWLDALRLTDPRFFHEDGSEIPFEATPAQYVLHPSHFSTIYAQNFNGGSAPGWTLTGLWRVTTGCSTALDGAFLAYNRDTTCTFDTGAATAGEASFAANLAGTSNPTLDFYHKWRVESYASAYDLMRVQVSTNGGGTWSTLAQWDSTMAAQSAWKHQTVSLSSYAGSSVRVRFHFDSRDSYANGFLGWLVDSVQVTSGSSSNFYPTACFSLTPTTGTTSTNFQVDASCSTDVETATSALWVRWRWETGGTWTGWTTTKTASHTYASTGSRTITLEVKDGAGAVSPTTRSVTVAGNVPPTACFSVTPSVGPTGSVFQANAACSSDPETPSSSLKVRWDWENNGQWTTWTTTKTRSYAYATSGDRTIAMQVKDEPGEISSTTRTVAVDNPPAACFTVAPTTGTTSTSFQVDASCSSDDLTSSANLYVRWLWDGVADPSGWTQSPKTASHQFSSDGSHTIQVEVRDHRNQVSAANRPVQVGAPTIGLSSGYEQGLGGWSTTGLWHVTQQRAHAGSWSAWYGQECCGHYNQQNARNSGYLNSPVFRVPTANPYLTYSTYYQTEGGSTYDRMTVEASTDMGSTWTQVDLVNGNGAMKSWFQRQVSLDTYKGATVLLRFKFDTMDAAYNNYEGWFVDDVAVAAPATTVTLYTTQWHHSTVQGNQYKDVSHHDGGFESSATVDDTSDLQRFRFDVHSGDYQGTSQAALVIHAKSVGCVPGAEYPNVLEINGHLWGYFDPCQWPSNQYASLVAKFKTAWLVEGTNAATLRSTGGATRGLATALDTTSGGAWSDVFENGVDRPGELAWTFVVWNSKEYDTLERYVTIRVQEPGKAPRNQFDHEGYVFYSPEKLDMLAFHGLDLGDGNSQTTWSSTRYVQNTVGPLTGQDALSKFVIQFNENLCQANPPNYRQSPSAGEPYSVYLHEEETDTFSGSQMTAGRLTRFLMHVRSDPVTVMDRQSYDDGERNPPAYGPGVDDGNGWKWDFRVNHFLRDCETVDRHGGRHPHQWYSFQVHVADVDTPVGTAEAMELGQKMADWAVERMRGHGVDPGTRTTLGFSNSGFVASWIADLIQTGDLASVNVNEFDALVFRKWLPFSRVATQPSFTPMVLFLPGHWLPDGITFDESGPVFRVTS